MDIPLILKHVLNLFIVAAPFLIVFLLVFRAAKKRRQKSMAVETINKALEEMREKVAVVTTAEVPGRTIERVLGPVSAEGEAYSGYFSAAEKKTLVLLMHRASLMGADAIVELKRAAPASEVKGALRRQVNIRFFGTAVKLAEIPAHQAREPGTNAG
ncbi:MAG: hypothetical protein H6P98_2726 [Candidatus Aminicenantes bacterium]|jgi:uncharacterized protein YbjQ (UPF0145 family)|nr:hypothetical protein [Candidatus Aminicenantes bacterium]